MSLLPLNPRVFATFVYAYNSASGLTPMQYPSDRTVQPSYAAVGRLSAVAATLNSVTRTYASAFAYNPAGQVTGFNYGNGVAASLGYSADRLQLTSLGYVKGTTNLLSLSYGYGSAGSNNGQIVGITDSTGTSEAE